MYTQTGSWIAIAGVFSFLISQIGGNVDTASVLQMFQDITKVVGELAVMWGIVHQYISHRILAKSAGMIK